jgi:PIN domain nuclease of toxin-antitoxin system
MKKTLSAQQENNGMPKNERFLLDTHIWVWLLSGDNRIKESSLASRIVSSSHGTGLFISTISIWEIAMLELKGRIIFSTGILAWIDDALKAPGLQVVSLLPEISVDSTRLPGSFHGDPADRIIVATARFLKCPLITADKKILQYTERGYLEAIQP